MKFVLIKGKYINVESIDYLDWSYDEIEQKYWLNIFFGNRDRYVSTKNKEELNEWLILLTGKGIEE